MKTRTQRQFNHHREVQIDQILRRKKMNKSQLQVKEFHDKFGVPVHDRPQVSISKDRALLRAKLIYEEFVETISGLNCCVDYNPNKGDMFVSLIGDDVLRFNLREVADGLGDLIYVINGCALELGIDLEPVLDKIHESNMSKMWTPEEWGEALASGRVENEGLSCVDTLEAGAMPNEKCLVVKRADSKIIKSPGFKKPDIAGILQKQMEA